MAFAQSTNTPTTRVCIWNLTANFCGATSVPGKMLGACGTPSHFHVFLLGMCSLNLFDVAGCPLPGFPGPLLSSLNLFFFPSSLQLIGLGTESRLYSPFWVLPHILAGHSLINANYSNSCIVISHGGFHKDIEHLVMCLFFHPCIAFFFIEIICPPFILEWEIHLLIAFWILYNTGAKSFIIYELQVFSPSLWGAIEKYSAMFYHHSLPWL